MGSEQSSNRRENKEEEATRRKLEAVLEQQKRILKELEENKRAADRASTPNGSVSAPSTAHYQQPNEFMERQRNMYYNQNQLQSQMSSPGNLYPNLNPFAPMTPQGTNNNNTTTTYQSPGTTAATVYNHSAYQNPQPAPRSQMPMPSAPPSDSPSGNQRSRSQSRQRGSEGELNCPTCGKLYGDRIYQCNHGHSSCDLCKKRQVPCGLCRQTLTDRRNFDLEKYVSERRVKCPNSTDGCRLHIKMADMSIHEKECPFKALKCPSLGGNCTWTGKPSQLASHFNESHESHTQADIDKEMFMTNITMTSHTMHYISLGPFNFLIHVKISEPAARIYIAAQLIGTKHSATKWDYEIHMFKKNEPRRKFHYTDRCSSTSESLDEIMINTKCAVIPIEYAKTFLYGGAIAYKLYLKRDDMKENNTERTDEGRKETTRAVRPRQYNNFKKYAKKN